MTSPKKIQYISNYPAHDPSRLKRSGHNKTLKLAMVYEITVTGAYYFSCSFRFLFFPFFILCDLL